MEVTKSNFKALLPTIKDAIVNADFLAIDTEFTGLRTEQKEHAFDTMDERYTKMREASKDFLVIQYGVSCFRFDHQNKKYRHREFNFYIFPNQYAKNAPDSIFICQASSMLFLISQGFDFNKLLNEGLSYLTPSQEKTLLASLVEQQQKELDTFAQRTSSIEGQNDAKKIDVPDEHKDFIRDILEQVDTFMAAKGEITLEFSPCSKHQRKLIYDTVGQKYPIGIDISSSQIDSKNSKVKVTKMSNEEKLKNLQLKHQVEKDNLDDAVGFRKVLDVIMESRKLVLGHNMMLDVLHTVNQFYYPLPETLGEFKELLKCVFPRLADTKNVAFSSPLKEKLESTALFELWCDLKNKASPIVESEEEGCYTPEMEKLHEAGYDAYITGMCFIKMCALLAESDDFIPIESKILSPYINRLYVMWHFDVKSLNLSGPDPEPKRDFVYYVTFPKEWRTEDLNQLFHLYGNIYISWINDVSALIALKSPEQNVNVRKTLLKQRSSIYKVQPYSYFLEMQKPTKVVPNSDPDLNNSVSPVSDPDLHNNKRRSSSGSIERHAHHVAYDGRYPIFVRYLMFVVLYIADMIHLKLLVPILKRISWITNGVLTNRPISPIIEEEEDLEENTTAKQDSCVSTSNSENCRANSGLPPKAKKQKLAHEDPETHEVTSTEKLFEEPDKW